MPVQTQDFLKDYPDRGVEDNLLGRQVSMWAENSMLLCAEADSKDAGLEHGQIKGKRLLHSQSWAKRGWNEKQLGGFLFFLVGLFLSSDSRGVGDRLSWICCTQK